MNEQQQQQCWKNLNKVKNVVVSIIKCLLSAIESKIKV